MFEAMLTRVRETVTGVLSHIQIQVQRPEEAEMTRPAPKVQAMHPEPAMAMAGADGPLTGGNGSARAAPARRPGDQGGASVSRKAPCPCGSGRKYKYCHGKICPQSRRASVGLSEPPLAHLQVFLAAVLAEVDVAAVHEAGESPVEGLAERGDGASLVAM